MPCGTSCSEDILYKQYAYPGTRPLWGPQFLLVLVQLKLRVTRFRLWLFELSCATILSRIFTTVYPTPYTFKIGNDCFIKVFEYIEFSIQMLIVLLGFINQWSTEHGSTSILITLAMGLCQNMSDHWHNWSVYWKIYYHLQWMIKTLKSFSPILEP